MNQMAAARLQARHVRGSIFVALALYGVVMSAGAFLHHDFACHQNSRTHCSSCVISQHPQKSHSAAAPVHGLMLTTRRVELTISTAVESASVCRLSSRAPPA